MADHGRLYAVNEEIQNNLIIDTKANYNDDECNQVHFLPQDFLPLNSLQHP
jgi:hypothetical protein